MNVKNRKDLLTIVALVAGVLLVGDRFILTPLIKSWNDRANRIIELRKQVTHGAQVLERERTVRTRWEEMRANTLASDGSEAEDQVLKAFDKWSQESRISISSIKPQWKHNSEDYMTLECRVDAAGSLASLTHFLYSIEKDPLAMKVEAVEITSRDNNGSQLALGLLVSALVLTPKER